MIETVPTSKAMSETYVSTNADASPEVVQCESSPRISYSYLMYNTVATAIYIWGNYLVANEYDTACKYWYVYISIGCLSAIGHCMFNIYKYDMANRKDSTTNDIIDTIAYVLIVIQIIIFILIPIWFLFICLGNKSDIYDLKKCKQLADAFHITDPKCDDIIGIIKFY